MRRRGGFAPLPCFDLSGICLVKCWHLLIRVSSNITRIGPHARRCKARESNIILVMNTEAYCPTVSELIAAIRGGAEVEDEGRNTQQLPWEITPAEYIQFAQQDLDDTGRRGTVNALGNAKRALECQLDSLLLALGLPKGKNVPKKLETLNQIGIIAPRILSKINRHRNELEHEYVCPNADTVADFVDVALLFVEATKVHIEDRICEWCMHASPDMYIRIRFADDGLHIAQAPPPHASPYVRVLRSSDEYVELLSALYSRR